MANRSKVAVCLIARMESTRLPRKVLADVAGKPMLYRLMERMQTCENIDDIVLCTADTPANQELMTAAKDWGVPAIAGSELDVLGRVLEGAAKVGADHLIRVTGDNICTDPTYLDKLIEAHLEQGAAYSRVNNLPIGMTAEVLAVTAAKRLHNEITDPEQTEYMILYAFDPDRYECVVLNAAEAHHRPNYTLSIDVPAEMRMANALFEAFDPTSIGPNIDQIIHWLDTHPDVRVSLANDAEIRMPYGKTISYGGFKDLMNERASRATLMQS